MCHRWNKFISIIWNVVIGTSLKVFKKANNLVNFTHNFCKLGKNCVLLKYFEKLFAPNSTFIFLKTQLNVLNYTRKEMKNTNS